MAAPAAVVDEVIRAANADEDWVFDPRLPRGK